MPRKPWRSSARRLCGLLGIRHEAIYHPNSHVVAIPRSGAIMGCLGIIEQRSRLAFNVSTPAATMHLSCPNYVDETMTTMNASPVVVVLVAGHYG